MKQLLLRDVDNRSIPYPYLLEVRSAIYSEKCVFFLSCSTNKFSSAIKLNSRSDILLRNSVVYELVVHPSETVSYSDLFKKIHHQLLENNIETAFVVDVEAMVSNPTLLDFFTSFRQLDPDVYFYSPISLYSEINHLDLGNTMVDASIDSIKKHIACSWS